MRTRRMAKRQNVPGTADWGRLYAKPEDMPTLPFGVDATTNSEQASNKPVAPSTTRENTRRTP